MAFTESAKKVGHGAHVAGIIGARGAPPRGVRGLAPGVELRSYGVFGKGQPATSNYAIIKAIDRAVADGNWPQACRPP